jgi:hypothetical protein
MSNEKEWDEPRGVAAGWVLARGSEAPTELTDGELELLAGGVGNGDSYDGRKRRRRVDD